MQKTSVETLDKIFHLFDHHRYLEVVVLDDDGIFSSHYFFDFEEFKSFVRKMAAIRTALPLKVFVYVNSRLLSEKVIENIHLGSSWLKEEDINEHNILSPHYDSSDTYFYVVEINSNVYLDKYIKLLEEIEPNGSYEVITSKDGCYIVHSFFNIDKFHQECRINNLQTTKVYKDGYVPVFIE